MLKYWLTIPLMAALMVGALWFLNAPETTNTSATQAHPADQSPPIEPIPTNPLKPRTDHSPQAVATESNHTPAAEQLKQINQRPNLFERRRATYALLDELGYDEVLNLLNRASRVVPPGDYVNQTTILFLRLAELDRPRAYAELSGRASTAKLSWISGFFLDWTINDAPAALTAAQALASLERQAAMRAVARMRPDLVDTAELGADWAASAILERGQSFAQAWQANQQATSRVERIKGFALIALQWVNSDPVAALAAVATLPDDVRRSIQSPMLSSWAQHDPAAMLDWLLQQPEAQRAGYLTIAAQAAPDMQAAEQIAQLGPESARNNILRRAMRKQVNTNTSAFERWTLNQTDEALRNTAFAMLARGRLNEQSADAALAWMDSLTPADKDAAAFEVLRGLARSAPQQVAERLTDVRPGVDRDRLATQVIQTLAQTSISAAQNFLDSAQVENKLNLYRNLTNIWAASDTPGALRYARSLEDTAQRDIALLGVARGSAEPDFDSLLDEVSSNEVRAQIERIRARSGRSSRDR